MKINEALEILEKGLNIANTKGAFLLRDATVIQQALDTVIERISPAERPAEKVPEVDRDLFEPLDGPGPAEDVGETDSGHKVKKSN
tara:strand:- start:20037 stop:20294 length:258 start_codon:yes stop_codon:yes gene_type:complete